MKDYVQANAQLQNLVVQQKGIDPCDWSVVCDLQYGVHFPTYITRLYL